MEPMINIALRAARKAGEFIVRCSDDLDRYEVKAKGVNDFVTEVDLRAEQEVIQLLRKSYPRHAFLAEESGLTGDADAEYRWVIDPLDGTTNFIRGIPHYAVSIACLHRGQIEHDVSLAAQEERPERVLQLAREERNAQGVFQRQDRGSSQAVPTRVSGA